MNLLIFSSHSMKYIWYSPQKSKYPLYAISQYANENNPKVSQICSYGVYLQERVRNSRGKRAIVFEPLKVYCILGMYICIEIITWGFRYHPIYQPSTNIGPRASPRSDIGRGLIDRVMTKTPCYDLFII